MTRNTLGDNLLFTVERTAPFATELWCEGVERIVCVENESICVILTYL